MRGWVGGAGWEGLGERQNVEILLPFPLPFAHRWLGLWMDQAEGISLENVVRLGKPMMHPNDVLDIMHDK